MQHVTRLRVVTAFALAMSTALFSRLRSRRYCNTVFRPPGVVPGTPVTDSVRLEIMGSFRSRSRSSRPFRRRFFRPARRRERTLWQPRLAAYRQPTKRFSVIQRSLLLVDSLSPLTSFGMVRPIATALKSSSIMPARKPCNSITSTLLPVLQT